MGLGFHSFGTRLALGCDSRCDLFPHVPNSYHAFVVYALGFGIGCLGGHGSNKASKLLLG
jgi:hypothetical protein